MRKPRNFFMVTVGESFEYELLTSEQKEELVNVLKTLTPREEKVVTLFYGLGQEPLTFDAIAEHFAVTTERIKQIRNKAICKLKHRSRLVKIKALLGIEVPEAEKLTSNAVEDLELSVRTYWILKNAGITSLEDLTKKTERWFLHLQKAGRKALNEVKDVMLSRGLQFSSEEQPGVTTCPHCGYQW